MPFARAGKNATGKAKKSEAGRAAAQMRPTVGPAFIVTSLSLFKNGFQALYEATPDARINLIKQGIEPAALNTLAVTMNEPKETIIGMLRLSRATVDRKAREHKLLPIDESERVLGMANLIGQVEKMVAESGNPDGFNAAHWVARWLRKPLPALNGRMPAEFMDTMEGQRMVENLLARAQAGAYA